MFMRRAVVVILISMLVVGCGEEASQQTTATQVSLAAPTEKPTSTPKPTKTPTPRPTRTPRPTNTPRPTRTPTPVPTATPTPEPISLNGSGQTVTDQIYIPYPLAKAIFTHDGGRNFIVHVYYDDGSEDYLVNKIGNYAGSQLIVGDQGAMFEINADGNWTLNVEPIGLDQSIASGARGQGDTVTDLFFPEAEKPVPYHFVHDGDSNFIVQLICGGGSDYVQNAIGAVDGQAVARFKKGPCLWDVTADGNWVIEPK